MEYENFVDRNDRLGSRSPRQEQLALVLAALETPRGAESESDIEALRLLVVDATLEQDDYALNHAVEGIHRLLFMWARDDADAAVVEARGELRGLHNVASMVLDRIVPLAEFAAIAPETLAHDVLAHIVAHPGCSNDDIVLHLGKDRTQISRAGRRLAEAGLARKHRRGTKNVWRATPRGVGALNAAAAGWPRPVGRQHHHV